MTYELVFDQNALKEWRKLDDEIRNQFKKKLSKILTALRIKKHNKIHTFPYFKT